MATDFATSIVSDEDSRRAGRRAAREALAGLHGSRPDLAVVFATSGYDCGEVASGIRETLGDVPLAGCSAAGVFTGGTVDGRSVSCALVSSDTHRFAAGLGRGLRADETRALSEAVSGFTRTADPDFPHRSCILFIDGLAGKGEEVTLAALSALGPDLKITGGSAADDYRFAETRVISAENALPDAVSAVLTLSKTPVAVGVSHGHIPVSPPFTITRAEGNRVYELDGKPALDVWLDATREHARNFGIDVDAMWDDPDQLGRFTCIYEGGLLTGEGYRIRWSGLRPDTRDHLPFVCTVPRGSVMRVMVGTRESQIGSARKAAAAALKGMNGHRAAGAFVFDCAVRGAILGDAFPRALSEIRSVLGPLPLIGAETYGEIALEEGQLSGFHNTTTVVLLLPD